MRISRLTWHKIFGLSLGLIVALLMANYFLDLGYFGQRARALLSVSILVFVIWAAYFMPTRGELIADRDARHRSR
jgi:hypothetical protein